MRPSVINFLVAIFVLGVFYPSIFSESLSIDDREMVQVYLNMQGLDWQGLFFPSTGVYYYRPLLGLTYWFDHIFFDHQTGIAHFENILIHLVSTVLLYRLLLRVVPEKEKQEWPLLAALFFGIHPLVTEPVNWISGRTDLLAGFFVLLSSLLFLGDGKKRIMRDCLAAFCFLCGLWSKEVAIGLLPVVFFAALQEHDYSLRRQWRDITIRVLPFLGATFLYGVMRTGGRIAQDVGVMTAVQGGHGAEHYSLIDKLFSLIKAIGFYAQKILWPFPLNFAIVDINRPVAFAVGIVVIAGFIGAMFFFRRRKFLLGLVWIACFLAPALPVAVNRVAWTPLAERYLYLPLMGLSLLLVLLLARMPRKTIACAVMGGILFGWGIATAQRNIVWQKNITLWQDVVEKSPDFAPGHNDYALALMREGKKEEAQWHLARAESLVADRDKSRVLINRAVLQEATLDQKIAQLEAILAVEHEPKYRVTGLKKMIQLINNTLVHDPMDCDQQMAWTRKALEYQQQLSKLDDNPYHIYRIGQLHLALGEKAAAQAAFATTCRSSNDYFTQPACTLAKRLAQETAGQ